jgi:GT2 family glycosyltransferase
MGMHRSGTSAVTGALQAAGLYGWEIGEEMGPALDNPLGFAERRDVVDIDDRMLGALGWTWDAPAVDPLDEPPSLDPMVAELSDLLSSRFRTNQPWIIKDPRICLLLPWWRRALDDPFISVVVVRDPNEVARSLAARNGFSLPLGMALWGAYHRHLVSALAGLPAVVVNYGALTEDPLPVLSETVDALVGLGLEARIDLSAAQKMIRPSLRRARHRQVDGKSKVGQLPAWMPARVAAFDRFEAQIVPAEPDEIALLTLQQQLRAAEQHFAAELAALQSGMGEPSERRELAERQLAEANQQLTRLRIKEATSRSVTRAGGRWAADLTWWIAGLLPGLSGTVRNPLFDPVWYRTTYPDLVGSPSRLAFEYHRRGWHQGRDPNPFFDTDWYLANNPDVQASRDDPLDHYLRVGGFEGRDPGPGFSSAGYLSLYSDVAASGQNPLLHYLRYGAIEGRVPLPAYDGPEVANPGVDVVTPARTPSSWLRRVVRTVSAAHLWSRLARLRRRLRVLVAIGRSIRHLRLDAASVAVLGGDDLGLGAQAREGRALVLPTPRALETARSLSARRGSGAVAAIESIRGSVRYVVVPVTSALRPDDLRLGTFLGRFPVVFKSADCVIHDLAAGPREPDPVGAVVARIRATTGETPAVLDWTSESSHDQGPWISAGVGPFEPPFPDCMALPYADASIDVVVIDADQQRLQEADRVARFAVVERGAASAAGDCGQTIWKRQPGSDLASVSIVIPTYNRRALLGACLDSIRETVESGIDYEVIVVDDASTDDSAAEVENRRASFDGRLSLIVNPSNLGFVGSVNRGADAATREVLVLLNNDTITLDGWLSALLRTLRDRSVGVVGGKLIYPDGRLQEAGGIIFSDASATNFGNGDVEPDAPAYAFLREVDYVSGALLATPRSLWNEVGGLDPVWGFGYYDDGDYSFKVRALGKRTVYQPASAIVHLEGGTAGTNVTTGVKQSQAANQAIFAERWKAELRAQPAAPGQPGAPGEVPPDGTSSQG